MEAERHGKELEWIRFTIDYQRCMFCELCVYPCPKDCIHEGLEFAFATTDRSELVFDLLSYKGMAREAKARMIEAEEKKRKKEEAKAAKAAAKAAESPAAASSGEAEGSEAEAPEEEAEAPEKEAEAPAEEEGDA
jgi:NADH-quinone oxidoreductase subunit I